MRIFHLIGSLVMLLSAIATWTTIARADNQNIKVHLLQNLDEVSLKKVVKLLNQKKILITKSPIFSESESTLIITRNENDPAEGIHIEIMNKKPGNVLPRSIYSYKLKSEDQENLIVTLGQAIPGAERIRQLTLNR